MKTNCVTHHYACYCREEIFKETQDKLKLALEIIEKLKKSNDFYTHKESVNKEYPLVFTTHIFDSSCVACSEKDRGELARQTQKEVNEMMEKLK